MQCQALAATIDPSMLELLRVFSVKNDGNYKDIPITFNKTITLGDIITLDRAVRKDTRSVVYFVTQIDSTEREADLENMRKAILRLDESLRSKISNQSKMLEAAY